MGDAPAGNVDPNGMATAPVANPYNMRTTGPGWVAPYDWRNVYLEDHWNDNIYSDRGWEDDILSFGCGGGGGSAGQNAVSTADLLNIANLCSNGYNVSTFFYNNGMLTGGIDGQGNEIPILPDILVTNHVADYAGWGKAMDDCFGQSLGWDFNGYGSGFSPVGLDPFISHINSTTTTLTSLYQYNTDMGPLWGSINRTVSGGVVSQNSNPNGYIQQNTTVNASGVSVGHSLSIGSTSNSVGLGISDELGLFSVQPQATISGTNYHLNIGIGKYGLPSIGYGTSTVDQNNLTESFDHTYDFGWWIFVPEIVQSVGGLGAIAF